MTEDGSHGTVFPDLLQEIAPPADGILSRTLLNAAGLKVVAFGFAAGEELSEHTASLPAVLQILQGEATLTLGNDRRPAGPGTWVYLPAQLPHSVHAKTPVVMLLLLLKSAE